MRGRSVVRWLGTAIVVVAVLGLDGLGAPESRAQVDREDVRNCLSLSSEDEAAGIPCPDDLRPVTVRAVLGYEAPFDRSDAYPLRLFFTVEGGSDEDRDVLITQVTIVSWSGSPSFYDYPDHSGGEPKGRYSPATRTAELTFDAISGLVEPGRLPIEVVVTAAVELTNGQRQIVRAPVRIEALYAAGVVREAPPSRNPAQGYDMKVRLDPSGATGGQVLARGDTVRGTHPRTLRLPVGAIVAVRHLDGTAMLMTYDTADVFYTDLGIGGASGPSDSDDPEGTSTMKIAQDVGQDRAQDAILKLLLRRLSGPVGLAVDVAGSLEGSSGGRGLVRVRLRSEVGIAVFGSGEITIRSFEGIPEVLIPEVGPLPAGQQVTLNSDGQVSGPVPVGATDPMEWLAGPAPEPSAQAAPVPAAQATQVGPLAVPTPTPPFVQPTRPAQFVLPTPMAPFAPLTPTPAFVPPTPTSPMPPTPTAPLIRPTPTAPFVPPAPNAPVVRPTPTPPF